MAPLGISFGSWASASDPKGYLGPWGSLWKADLLLNTGKLTETWTFVMICFQLFCLSLMVIIFVTKDDFSLSSDSKINQFVIKNFLYCKSLSQRVSHSLDLCYHPNIVFGNMILHCSMVETQVRNLLKPPYNFKNYIIVNVALKNNCIFPYLAISYISPLEIPVDSLKSYEPWFHPFLPYTHCKPP